MEMHGGHVVGSSINILTKRLYKDISSCSTCKYSNTCARSVLIQRTSLRRLAGKPHNSVGAGHKLHYSHIQLFWERHFASYIWFRGWHYSRLFCEVERGPLRRSRGFVHTWQVLGRLLALVEVHSFVGAWRDIQEESRAIQKGFISYYRRSNSDFTFERIGKRSVFFHHETFFICLPAFEGWKECSLVQFNLSERSHRHSSTWAHNT